MDLARLAIKNKWGTKPRRMIRFKNFSRGREWLFKTNSEVLRLLQA